MIGDRIEPDDGDERKVGTVSASVPICVATRLSPRMPPPDHPAWDSVLVTPADLRAAAGLVVAREMPEVRRGR